VSDEKRVKSDEVQEELTSLLGKVENSQKSGFQLLAKRQAKKQARRRAVAERLAEHLEKDDPRLVQIQKSAEQAGELGLAANQRAKRLEILPKVRADDWVVTGVVRYADGTPGSRLTVQVFDKDHKYDDLLGTTKTNEFGDFVIVYNERDFSDNFRDELPDLYVMVRDREGKQLIADKTPVRHNAGRTEHFEIQLGQLPTTRSSATRKRKSARTK
jgi:hypothetical protein